MATITPKKSVFDMDQEEMRERLTPAAVELKRSSLDNGAWYSYQNELCTESNMFIREFKDGHKELVQLSNKTGDYKLLKVF
jgi:hypothetical protein